MPGSRHARNPSCPGAEGRADLHDLLSGSPHLRQRQLDDPGRHPVEAARSIAPGVSGSARRIATAMPVAPGTVSPRLVA